MKTIAIFSNSSKPLAKEYAEYSSQKLKDLGAEVIAKDEFCEELSKDYSFIESCDENDLKKKADMVLTFGGDGTILSAAKLFLKTGVPIMGVNVGKLGFLAEYHSDKLDECLTDLIDGNFRVVERAVLEAKFKEKTFYALNDFVIEKSATSRMITVTAYTNGNHVADYKADGLIVTTPTGSTAYSLSCGGPIITPGTPVFCLTPISPHTLNLRPLIIPDSSEIRLKVYSRTGSAQFVVDGREIIPFENKEEVILSKSEEKIKLIKPLNTSYYDLLRDKLLWAADAKTKLKPKINLNINS